MAGVDGGGRSKGGLHGRKGDKSKDRVWKRMEREEGE